MTMNAEAQKKSLTQWLFNPFRYVAGVAALVTGLAAVLLSGLLGSVTTVHFDGVLDIHVGARGPVWAFLSEGVIAWACLSATLVVAGAVFHRCRFRPIDVMGTQALARWPGLLAPLILLVRPVREGFNRGAAALLEKATGAAPAAGASATDCLLFGLVALLMLVVVVWMVALMYRGYAVSCNARGARAIVTFIAGVVAAEVLSKVVLWAAVVPHLGGN
jgi:hypothetical protein